MNIYTLHSHRNSHIEPKEILEYFSKLNWKSNVVRKRMEKEKKKKSASITFSREWML